MGSAGLEGGHGGVGLCETMGSETPIAIDQALWRGEGPAAGAAALGETTLVRGSL